MVQKYAKELKQYLEIPRRKKKCNKIS